MITVRWPRADATFPQVEFRRLFRQIRRSVAHDAEMVTAYTDGVVTLRSNRRLDGYHEAADMSGMQGVKVGDFVVHGLDILRGSVGVSDADGAMSSVCVICAPIADVEPRYFAWQIRAQAASGLPRALARGVREGGADFRRWDTLAELPVLCPPRGVQRAIADFLDTETARIDALITKKLRLVELLKCRANSRVAQFLAGEVVGHPDLDFPPSLARTASYFPSAAPLGVTLRNGWNWVRFGSLVRHIDERSTTGTEVLLSVSKVHGVIPRDQIADRPPRADSLVGYKRCRKGDFIVNQMSAYDGLMGIAPTDGIVTYHYLVFRPYQPVDLRFVQLLLTSEPYRQDFSRRVRGLGESSQGQVRTPHIRISDMLQTLLPMPTHGSEVPIVKAITGMAARERALLDRLHSQVDLLREHREALITAAVTGELEVPGVAA